MTDFGLMFYNDRFFDPTIGRFVQADTVVPSGVQGYDRYAYANNSPVLYSDPTGHNYCDHINNNNAEDCNGGESRINNSDSLERLRKQHEASPVKNQSMDSALLDVSQNLGVGYISPDLTFGFAEEGAYAFDFYYRLGLSTGGGNLVLYPLNDGIATPHFYTEGGEVGFTSGVYQAGNTTIDQDLGISLDKWTLTLNYDQTSKSPVGNVSVYQYAGFRQSMDLRGPTLAAGAVAALYDGPAVWSQLQEFMSRRPAFGY